MAARHRTGSCLGAGQASLALLAAAAIFGPLAALASNTTVETCPDAQWKKLPFMKAPSSGFDPISWNMEQIQEYGKTTVLMSSLQSIILFVLCLIFLLVFILWRFFKCICLVCCQQESTANPEKILLGKKLTWTKVAIAIFGLTGLAFGAFGMIKVNKELISGFWKVEQGLVTYTLSVADGVDRVINSTSNITIGLDALRDVVLVDVNTSGIKADVKGVAYFLDNAPTPASFKTAIQNLDTGKADIAAKIAALSALLAPTSTLSKMLTAMPNIAGSQNYFTNTMQVKIDAYFTALGNLPAPTPATNNAAVTALSTAQADMAMQTWIDYVVALRADVATLTAAKATDPFAALDTTLGNMATAVSDMKNVKLPAVKTKVTDLNNIYYYNTSSNFKALLARIKYVNESVVELNNATTASVNNMNDTVNSLDAFYAASPSPLTFNSDIDALSAKLVMPSDTATLRSSATTASTQLATINNAAVTSLDSALAALKTALDDAKVDVDAIGAALTSFLGGSNPAYTTLKNAADATITNPTGKMYILKQTALPNAITAATAINGPATSVSTATSGMGPQLTTQRTNLDSINAQLATFPSTATYLTSMDGVQDAFDKLPNPKSGVTNDILDTIADLEDVAIVKTNEVKGTVTSTVNSLKGGTATIRVDVVGQLGKLRTDYEDLTSTYYGYVYNALLGLYGLVLLWIISILVCSYFNNPGAMSTFMFWLLITLPIFMILPVLYNLSLVGLNDACYSMESLVIGRVGDSGSTPRKLLDFYLFQQGAPNIRALLNTTGIVDLSQVEGQINSTKTKVVSEVTAQFKPKAKLQGALDLLLGSVDGVLVSVSLLLDLADYGPVNAQYRAFKSFPCCDIPNMFADQWIGTFFTGLMGWVLLFAAFIQLGQLDKLPKDGCCGCQRFSKDDYRAMPNDDYDGRLTEIQLPEHSKTGKGKDGLGRGPASIITIRAEMDNTPTSSPFANSGVGSPFAAGSPFPEQPLLAPPGMGMGPRQSGMGLLAPSGNSYTAQQRPGYDAVSYGALPNQPPSV